MTTTTYSENQTIHIGSALYHNQTVLFDEDYRTCGTTHMNGRIWHVANNNISPTMGYGYARSWSTFDSEPARPQHTSLVQRTYKYDVPARRRKTGHNRKRLSFVVMMLQYPEEALLTSLGATIEKTFGGDIRVIMPKQTTYFRGTTVQEYDSCDGYTGKHRYDTYVCKNVELHIKQGSYPDQDYDGDYSTVHYTRLIVPTNRMDIIHPQVLNHREEWVNEYHAGGTDLMQKDLPPITHPEEDDDEWDLGDLDEHPF